jgi:hypothetical protein
MNRIDYKKINRLPFAILVINIINYYKNLNTYQT